MGPLFLKDSFIRNGLTITDVEDDSKKYRLSIGKCRRALQVMAEKYPAHFADALSLQSDYFTGDVTTGDVFLQCAIFGEIVYG